MPRPRKTDTDETPAAVAADTPKRGGSKAALKEAAAGKKAPSGPVDVKSSRTGLVTFPGIKLNRMNVLVVGTAPLIVNRFDQKFIDAILAKHMGQATAGRAPKDPIANFNGARHRLSDGSGDGFPSGGIKACIASGGDNKATVAKTKLKGGIRIEPDDPALNLVRIITPGEPEMLQSTVRNESGVVDIRHRPQYWPWAMLLRVVYLPNIASPSQLLQAIETAGFTIGLGEWRPGSPTSMSGTFGSFRVANDLEAEAYEDGRLFDVLGGRSPALPTFEDLRLDAAE